MTVIENLVRVLGMKGVKSTVFAACGRGVGKSCAWPGDIDTRIFAAGLPAYLWTAFTPGIGVAICQEIENFDVVHIHELWHHPGYAAYKAVQASNTPYVVSLHGELNPWAIGHKAFRKLIYMKLIQRRILTGAAAIHAHTTTEAEEVRKHDIPTQVVVIPNGISPEKFERGRKQCLSAIGLANLEGKKVILFLGRIHPIKGLDVLARAYGRIARERSDVVLVIAGPDVGGHEVHIKFILKEEEVLDRTVFTGIVTRESVVDVLHGADIFVAPSYSEGFSMSILEALACGLPMVVTRNCAFPEVGKAGAALLVEPRAEEIAASLSFLLDHPEEREAMGARGKRLVKRCYTWDKVGSQLIETYKSILNIPATERMLL